MRHVLRFSWGLRCTVNNQWSPHSSIDNWCPALLAPLSAIKRLLMSVVCVSGSHCSCGACHAVAEQRSWLKSTTAQCTEDIWGLQCRVWHSFSPFSCCCQTNFNLYATFSSYYFHVNGTKKEKDFKVRTEEAKSTSEKNKKQDRSKDRLWLQATLQCNSLGLIAN